jgi:2-dehydropantoate 2-reductase
MIEEVVMRIAVYGTGGVGGYFGGRLAQAGEDVVFIARGDHLQAMISHGLRVDSTKGGGSNPPPATKGLSKGYTICVILFCLRKNRYPTLYPTLTIKMGLNRGFSAKLSVDGDHFTIIKIKIYLT